MGTSYRNTFSTPAIKDFPRISVTIPQAVSGGSISITFSGTHTITIEENTLGIDIPSSFTDSLTLSRWSQNGIIVGSFD